VLGLHAQHMQGAGAGERSDVRPVIREKGGGEQGRGRTRHICVRSDVDRNGENARLEEPGGQDDRCTELDVEAGTVETLSARTYSKSQLSSCTTPRESPVRT